MPMQSQLMKLPLSFDRTCVLVPRVDDKVGSTGHKLLHQRCFQLLLGGNISKEAGLAGAEILRFIEAVAENKAGLSGTVSTSQPISHTPNEAVTPNLDSTDHSKYDTAWISAVAQIYSAVVTLPIAFAHEPQTCPAASKP